MTTYKKKAIHRTAFVFTINILAALIGYLIRIFLARNLTPAEYGLFFSMLVLVNFIAFFRDLGLYQSLIKFIPQFLVKKKLNLIKSSFNFVLYVNLFLSILISIVLYFFSGYLAKYYFKEPVAANLLILFLITFLILATFKGTISSFFLGFQKIVPFALMYFFENGFTLIFLFLLFTILSTKIYAGIFAYTITMFILPFIFLPFFLKIFPYFKIKSKQSKKLSSDLLKFGLPVLIGSIGAVILLYTDTLVLTYFRDLKEVGIYNVLVPTVMMLAYFNKSIVQVVFPMVSEIWTLKRIDYLQKGIFILQKYTMAIILPIALIIFSFPKILINILFGHEYLSGALTLKILIIGMLFFVIANINLNIMSAIGKPKISSWVMMIGALFNFLTNLYFIPKLGMLGAGITSLLSYFLIFILSSYKLSDYIKIKKPWWIWIKNIIAGLIFVFIIFLLKKEIAVNPFLELIIVSFIAGIFYILFLFLFKIIKIEEIKEYFIKI